MSTNRLVLLAAVPVFLILALVAYITIQFAVNERDAQAWVRHTYQVIAQLGRVLADAQDAETGQRGYLLTGRQDFLIPYRDGRAHIASDLRTFRDLTHDNHAQQDRAAALEKLVTDRFSAFEASLSIAGPGTRASPQLIAALVEGKARMDALRKQVTQGMADERRLLAERDASRRRQETLEIGFAVTAAVLTLGVLLLAAALLVRNNLSLAASERSRANEAAILQATLESVREGIAYFTSEGLLCAFNANFFELLNLPRGLAVLQTTTLMQLNAAQDGLGQLLSPPPRQEPEESHIAWGGRELDIYKAPVSTGGFLIGLVDVTARLRAEGMARQSQKMEAIGHLTGGVAHDFNNLLQIISANLDLAQTSDTVQADLKLHERLQHAAGAVMRGSRLTGQLLAFARRQALAPRSVDLGRSIRDLSDLLRRTLGEQIEIETVIAGGLWNTLADPTQVENSILNLAINARDAMPDGGKLTLEVANASLDDAYAGAHTEVTPGQYVMLAVSDTGTGMTPEVKARVFEPFFTTKPEGKGTGLGLAQAYGFVKQSGGHIKIYSELGHGTTIKIYLPRTRREKDEVDTTSGLPAQGGDETILVVEDDEDVRTAVVDMLGDLGYRVQKAENAETALALLQAGGKVDLLFTDVVMPGAISTREFTRRAQEMQPSLKVLYTSGYTQNAIVHNGKLDDDAFLLSKPYRRDELARKLRSVFSGSARGAIAPPAVAPDMAVAERRGKVLVVEDMALIRMTTMDMIEQIGFEAAEAADGAAALTILQSDPAIEILLTDLGLPGMNGRQLVEEALRIRPSLRVIIASGYSTERDQPSDTAVHLAKPFDLAQLRKALEG